jgi:hypothetical protein
LRVPLAMDEQEWALYLLRHSVEAEAFERFERF